MTGRGRLHRVRVIAGAAAAALAFPLLLAACERGPREPRPTRLWTDDLEIRISMDPTPPHAREQTLFKVVVNDKESGQPIENGEGRIFAMNEDSVQKWDGLAPGPETGTYYARLNFVTSGMWALGMQFRRDSTKPLQRADWTQEVRAERGGP